MSIIRPPPGFAVDGNYFALGELATAQGPGKEAFFKADGVDFSEDAANGIMEGDAIGRSEEGLVVHSSHPAITPQNKVMITSWKSCVYFHLIRGSGRLLKYLLGEFMG
jgi:hypothetical protein